MRTTVLEGALKAIKESGHREEDVDYVGSHGGSVTISPSHCRRLPRSNTSEQYPGAICLPTRTIHAGYQKETDLMQWFTSDLHSAHLDA